MRAVLWRKWGMRPLVSAYRSGRFASPPFPEKVER